MKLIKFLFVIIVGLVITNVTLTNRTVDESIMVANLNREISILQDQNTILASTVAEAGSLGNLTAKLTEAGYTESPKVVSLGGVASVASR